MTLQDRNQLREAFDVFMRVPFPADSATSEQLSQLHAELVMYDAHIAGLVATTIGGGEVSIASLAPDVSLRARLKMLAENTEDPVRSEARQHLVYCETLDALADLARLQIATASAKRRKRQTLTE